jgi:ribosomal protein L29
MDKTEKTKKSQKDTKIPPKPELKKSPTELLKECRLKLNMLQIQHKMGNLPSAYTHQLRALRKEIARLLTKINMDKKNINI